MRYFLFLSVLTFCLVASPLSGQRNISLDDCFTFYKFYPESGPSFSFMADGKHYSLAEEGNLVQYDLVSQKPDSILIKASDLPIKFDQYEFSADEQVVLLRSNTTPVYRHSTQADYHVFDRRTRRLSTIGDGKGHVQCAEFAPDGQKIAYVTSNNVWIRHLTTGTDTQVTFDGVPNQVINGLPDWVYEEEFSPVAGDGMKALSWSTDGERLAFLRFDERAVPTMQLTRYENETYPQYTRFRYPKVGESNSTVQLLVYDLPNGALAPVEEIKTNADDYIIRLQWASKFNLTATVLNRRQDSLSVILLTPDRVGRYLSFAKELLLLETDSAYVEAQDYFQFIDNGQKFIWASERSGFNHLYLYDFVSGNLIRSLTAGAGEVTALYGIDEQRGKFYYQAATPTPLDRQIWEGDLTGGPARLLTPQSGTHDADFSPTCDFFSLKWSDANTPPVATLRDRSGQALKTFTDNPRTRQVRNEYGFVPKTFFKIPIRTSAGDSLYLNASIMRPPAIPGDTLQRRYPVLFDIYGGPGSQTVQNSYDGFVGSWHQMLVQKGYIVVSVDNRGTGARGRAFKKCTQLQLGRYETEDQIAAARYLGTLPYVDPARIGIWGWSFGGYLSTSCVLKGPDVFKMAMAVAPVTNWKWYDSAYTERYMHTTTDNAAGYETNSPVNFAAQLRGNNYLICHGIADDNVHWQQTTEMINALIRAGKQFETVYYPNRNHGIYGENATRHLFTKLTDFILKKL
jgi:dipeptidyl-peptidase 4